MFARFALSFCVSMGLGSVPSQAQDDDFYRGKTVRVLAAFDAAGNAGLIVQAVANHLGKHLPGNPTVIPQFMPGGGGLVQANYIYSAAPKDGTVLGLLFDNLPTTQVLEPGTVKFDAKRFTVIGALNRGENGALAIRSDHPVKKVTDARHADVVMASTGPGTTAYSIGNALNGTLGTRFKLVMGYTSGGTMLRAFEQGEVSSLLLDYNSLTRDSPHLIQSGLMKFLLQIGERRDPEIADTPLLTDVAETTQQRDVFELLSAGRRMGKVFVAPPEVPAERASVLRKAFAELAADPDFVADAARVGTKVEARSYESAAAVIRETVEAPEATVALAAKVSVGAR
jgi:tripartite-type tricarboxylate transporter receptor subunit TctC